MPTNVFLVRSGQTGWCRQRVLGRRDVTLSPEGVEQAAAAAAALSRLDVTEIIASPLARATETATRIAERWSIDVAKDPRLTDVHMGSWEGQGRAELQASEEYAKIADGEAEQFPGGERLEQVRARVRASVAQVLADNVRDCNILVVSHSVPLRILLADCLGMPVAMFGRLTLQHGAISIVRYQEYPQQARVMLVNWRGPDVRPLVD